MLQTKKWRILSYVLQLTYCLRKGKIWEKKTVQRFTFVWDLLRLANVLPLKLKLWIDSQNAGKHFIQSECTNHGYKNTVF